MIEMTEEWWGWKGSEKVAYTAEGEPAEGALDACLERGTLWVLNEIRESKTEIKDR